MEGMSEREYSAHSGGSRGAIQKARKASRLSAGVPVGPAGTRHMGDLAKHSRGADGGRSGFGNGETDRRAGDHGGCDPSLTPRCWTSTVSRFIRPACAKTAANTATQRCGRLAHARLGNGDRAHALFALLNPINHAVTTKDADRCKVELYVIAADVYCTAPLEGAVVGRSIPDQLAK
jgi:hypothetical protein